MALPYCLEFAYNILIVKERQMAKIIVITGASSGLGAALAKCYAQPDTVLGLIGRDTLRLNTIASECTFLGATVITATIDVTEADRLGEWLKEFDKTHPVDLIIANAGISAGTGNSSETIEQIKSIFEVNLNGVINTLYPLIIPMQKRRYGHIAIISSIAGFRGSPTAPAYSTSKAAVRVYGQALHGLLNQNGITVSVVCPGFIKTPMTDVNPFPMPFIMDANKAARLIKKGLDKHKTTIILPWIMGVIARLQNLLPDQMVNKIYLKIPAKPPS